MTLIPLIATKETIDMKKHGLVTFETDIVTDGPGIILLNNPEGKFGVSIVNQLHEGGKVTVLVRAISQPVLKPNVGDIVAQLVLL